VEALGETTAAAFEATVFLGYFKDMPDPRQPGKVAYRLDEVLLLALMAVLAGAEGFTDIARFGQKKLDLLRRFLPFANGTPFVPERREVLPSMAISSTGVFVSAPTQATKHRRNAAGSREAKMSPK
jgi:DDE_Tnp_1-associated